MGRYNHRNVPTTAQPDTPKRSHRIRKLHTKCKVDTKCNYPNPLSAMGLHSAGQQDDFLADTGDITGPFDNCCSDMMPGM